MPFFYIRHLILNTIGGTLRWIYGSIWRSILNKPKFTYKEYLHGPKNSDDYYDKTGHQFNNKMIALIFLGIVITIIVKIGI